MLKCDPHFASSHKVDLSEKNECYVLITCGQPTKDGQINVEMTYGGDPILAAYLVESASTMMDVEL